LGSDPDSLLQKKFSSAAALWLETRKPYLNENTVALYEHHISQLAKFFGEMTIQKIHLGHLREYQRARVANSVTINGVITSPWKKPAGASLIKHELVIVQGILKRAGLWKKFGAHYEALPLPKTNKQKVMTDLEEARLFDIASQCPEFELAYWVAVITASTTAAGSELRYLRLKDVQMETKPPRITVRTDKAKNGYRGRVIALNQTAFEMMQNCIQRANKMGSILPDHYIFPARVKRNKWNPEKPASESWLKKSFAAMREAADLPWLTPHCLRHQAITRMLELGTPEETVRSIAGHVSEQMMRHYAHTRIAAQMTELEKLDPRHWRKVPSSVRVDSHRAHAK
jgi:integrase